MRAGQGKDRKRSERTVITPLNRRINAKCELIAQVQIGFLIVDIYSWGNVVVSNGPYKDWRVHVNEGRCVDNWMQLFPPGRPDLSSRLAREISQARRPWVVEKGVSER